MYSNLFLKFIDFIFTYMHIVIYMHVFKHIIAMMAGIEIELMRPLPL